jgi:hypothetical protein
LSDTAPQTSSAGIISKLPAITANSRLAVDPHRRRAIGDRIGDGDVEAGVVGDERAAGQQDLRASGRARARPGASGEKGHRLCGDILGRRLGDAEVDGQGDDDQQDAQYEADAPAPGQEGVVGD